MAQVNFSLKSFKMGEVGATGAMGTVLTQFDDPVENTCIYTEATGSDTSFRTEISDNDYFKFTVPGTKTVEADFYAKDVDQLIKVFGGTKVAGTAGAGDTWKAPLETFTQEQSIELTQRNGAILRFPRVQVQCRFDWNFRKNALPLIHFVGTVLTPTDGTSSPVEFVEAAA